MGYPEEKEIRTGKAPKHQAAAGGKIDISNAEIIPDTTQEHKPAAYWTDETIMFELEPIIIKLGHFPTQIELIRMGEGGVEAAMSRSGGIMKFQKLLGFDR